VQVLSTQDYLKKVAFVRDSDMRTLQTDIDRVGELHARALDGSDPNAQRQLDALVGETQLKNTRIRDQLRTLKNDAERTSDPAARALKVRQFKVLNDEFKKQVEGYLQKEQQYKENYRRQIERQYRIVNPDATNEEIQQAADADWGNEGIFQTAVSRPCPIPRQVSSH
jgi:syntaxin 1B/2/3